VCPRPCRFPSCRARSSSTPSPFSSTWSCPVELAIFELELDDALEAAWEAIERNFDLARTAVAMLGPRRVAVYKRAATDDEAAGTLARAFEVLDDAVGVIGVGAISCGCRSVPLTCASELMRIGGQLLRRALLPGEGPVVRMALQSQPWTRPALSSMPAANDQ
jgi:hypothetical protein